MRFLLPCTSYASIIAVLPLLATAQNATRSSKRGLVYVANKHSVSDDKQFISSWSDLTWYYNYANTPTTTLGDLEFVPMLWGPPPSTTDTTFLDSVTSQLSSGANITHVLSFNEPDGSTSTGGSDMTAELAASTWMREIAPLRTSHGIKVGLPAVTGSQTGFDWLGNFNTSCEQLNSSGCVADFIPIHWYGNFEGMASHIGQVRAAYPQLPIWITEYAESNVGLTEAQTFTNQSMQYFDGIDYIERYSYFGSFRSDDSNVGKDVAMLDNSGRLTDIGSWYLGGKATGHNPSSSGAMLVKSTGHAIMVAMAVCVALVLQVVL